MGVTLITNLLHLILRIRRRSAIPQLPLCLHDIVFNSAKAITDIFFKRDLTSVKCSHGSDHNSAIANSYTAYEVAARLRPDSINGSPEYDTDVLTYRLWHLGKTHQLVLKSLEVVAT
jgi:hypothetical protein